MKSDIAVIGMSGKFPEARTIDEFYRNLREGKDSVRPLSLSRIRDTSLSPARRYRKMGFLEDIDKFDFSFFDILQSEAECMAPQHRLLLQVAYEALESAGCSPDKLAGSRTAVYVAGNADSYYKLAGEVHSTLLTGNLPACMAGRISRYFNFTGNAVLIDTACSSSLVALHMACRDILSGDAEMALCGGVHLALNPPPATDSEDIFGITSREGKCRTFSADADGIGIGEAAACVLLKPLPEAIRDRDPIFGVIKSSAVNQDAARSSTLTAPSSIAQAEVIAMAIDRAGIDPATLTFIEAHGTGTRLGDPIEIEGLTMAFRRYTTEKQFCAISALKSNLGHCDVAAGIVGFIKAVLSLYHKELFPSLHVKEINPYIDFPASPFYVNLECRTWLNFRDQRRAGVSSFGISGTNCHVIVEEWNGSPEPSTNGKPFLFILTGHTRHALERNAAALREFVDQNRSISLGQISYTLNTGRKKFLFRKSIVAASHDELINELGSMVAPEKPSEQTPGIWYLFAGSDTSGAPFLRELGETFPAFGKAYKECVSVLSGIDAGSFVDYSFGYCFYALLKALGLEIKQVMGLGKGKDLAKLAAGKLTLKDLPLAGEISGRQDPAAPDWEVFTESKLKGQGSLVWEIGLGAKNHKTLDMYRDEHHVFESVNPLVNASVRDLLVFIGRLAEAGLDLNWRELFTKVPVKVSLPVYQFERQRCWIKNADVEPVASWIYQQSWKPLPDLTASNRLTKDLLFILYSDNKGIAEDIGARLRSAGASVCTVCTGTSFTLLPNDVISFDWADEANYSSLLTELAKRQAAGIVHIHFGGCSAKGETSIEDQFAVGLYPLLLLVKAIGRAPGTHSLKVISDCAVAISGMEAAISPSGGAMHGFVAGVRAEMTELSATCIDIDSKENADRMLDLLYREILGKEKSRLVVGLRDGRRYQRDWTRPMKREPIPLESGGVYLITGGASGIGLQVLQSISYCKAVLIVTGRRRLPNKRLWPFVTKESHPECHETIRGFIRAEDNGSTVVYYAADVSDTERMSEVFGMIEQKYAPLQGIIHAAGIGGKTRIQRHTVETFRETLLAKAHGAEILYSLADKQTLRFFILFSSYSSFLSAERESNYSAANAFLDSFSARLTQENVTSVTIRWPFWKQTGMGSRMHQYDDVVVDPEMSIGNRQGIDVFDHILRQGYADVIVSKKEPELLMGEKPAGKQGEMPRKNIPLEEVLAEIWRRVLSREDLRPEDNFFQAGGHSLLGLQMRNQIEKKTGIKLEYRDIAENPTMSRLAARLRALGVKEEGKNAPFPRMPQQDKYPLSAGQKGIWLISQKEQKTYLYNICFGYTLYEPVEIGVLHKAVEFLVLRHEILRTKFYWDGDAIFQRVLPMEEVDTPVEYLTAADSEEMNSVLENARRHELPLDKAPLFRIWLIRRSGGGHVLFISIHHIILDGLSAHIFFSQLLSYYDQVLRTGHAVVPSDVVQYKDYVLWEEQQLSGLAADGHKQFWRQYLNDLPGPLDLPLDNQRNAVRSGNGANYRFSLSGAHAEAIGRLGAAEGGSKFLVCLTLFQILLYRYCGQQDFFIGTASTLRSRPEFEDQLGYYVNMLPLRCNVSGTDTFDTLFQKACQSFKTVQDHQMYPFSRMIGDAGIRQAPGRHYLFDIVFLYEYQLGKKGAGENNSSWRELGDLAPSSKYDIEFVLKEKNDGIMGVITYDTDLFREDTIARMASHFVQLADTITLSLTVDRFHFERAPSFSPAAIMENMSFDFE